MAMAFPERSLLLLSDFFFVCTLSASSTSLLCGRVNLYSHRVPIPCPVSVAAGQSVCWSLGPLLFQLWACHSFCHALIPLCSYLLFPPFQIEALIPATRYNPQHSNRSPSLRSQIPVFWFKSTPLNYEMLHDSPCPMPHSQSIPHCGGLEAPHKLD